MENINLVDVLIVPLIILVLWTGILLLLWSKSKILSIVFFLLIPLITFFISPNSFSTVIEFVTLLIFGLEIILIFISRVLYKKFPVSPEKIDMQKYLKLSSESIKSLCKLDKREDLLWAKEAHIKSLNLKKRKDGKFDERSQAGEDANNILENINDELSTIYSEKAQICYKQEKYKVKYLYISLMRYVNNTMIICSSLILIASNYFLIINQNSLMIRLLNEIYNRSNMKTFLEENIIINLLPVGIFILPTLFAVFLFGFLVEDYSMVNDNSIFRPSVYKKYDQLEKIVENFNKESMLDLDCD